MNIGCILSPMMNRYAAGKDGDYLDPLCWLLRVALVILGIDRQQKYAEPLKA